jgi:hypothetical protein
LALRIELCGGGIMSKRQAALKLEAEEHHMRAAAIALKDLYEPGGELTEWTSMDAEEILDDYCLTPKSSSIVLAPTDEVL